jgi:membrane protease YdiL (CAAX protease family)
MENKTINWGKTLCAAVIPPLELFIGALLIKQAHSDWTKAIISDLVFLVGFIIAIMLFRDVLKKDWPTFKTHIWRNLGLAILGVLASYAILTIVRSAMHLIGFGSINPFGGNLLSAAMDTAALGLVGSLTALMAPFTEEIVFRHALFYQFKNQKTVMIILGILSSIYFGLVHWNNFNGDVTQMVPYMIMGGWFAFIYYKSKNIWQNIATHFIFDFLTVAGAIVLVILTALGIV